jgi:hypothetical protein
MMMSLSAIAALLIGLYNHSATERALHYPRPAGPIIDQTFTTASQPRDLLDAPRIKKEQVPAKKDKPKKNINGPRVLFAKADTAKKPERLEIKNKPDRVAHLNKPKGLAPQREKPKVLARQRYERPGYYGNTMGYAQETQYGPQRLFSTW